MLTGRKSLLFGVHQFIWHPITVFLAWRRLYGRPNWKEFVCIVIHDWGYWFAPNMDGEEGEKHPEFAARLAYRWLGMDYHDICLFHSRHYARNLKRKPSKLCWADKLSILYEPWWWYLPRAWLSAELWEYRENAKNYIPLSASHKEWFFWVQSRLAKIGKEMRGDAVPYFNKNRKSNNKETDAE